MRYLAGVELGGTSCVACVSEADNPTIILHRGDFVTSKASETLGDLVDFLQKVLLQLDTDKYAGIGIASFGPVDLRQGSMTYGYITSTPKPGWRGIDVVGPFRRAFGDQIPIRFETDVNAPAQGEAMMQDVATELGSKSNVVYVTVGTGVGVGVYMNGAPVHGLLHPEAGHMFVGKKPGDTFPGSCVFHKNCVEGMVNSIALSERAGVQASELKVLPDSSELWEIVGYYLGALCVNLTFTLSPDVIIFGGGIMERKIIFDHCRETFKSLINGYLDVDLFKTEQGLAKYIRGSKFGNKAGIIGALLLAKQDLK